MPVTYPKLGRMPKKRTILPELDGGINLSKAKTEIADNQLTECCNVWYQEGRLQTRAGVKCNNVYTEDDIKETGVTVLYKGKFCSLKYCIRNWSGEKLAFIFVDEDGNVASDSMLDFTGSTIENVLFVPYVKASVQYVYAYVSYIKNNIKYNEIYKIDINENNCSLITPDDYETPTVLVNVNPGQNVGLNGISFESYNRLNGKYKVLCTTEDKIHTFFFPNLQKEGTTVVVEFYTTRFGYQKIELNPGDWRKEIAISTITEGFNLKDADTGKPYTKLFVDFQNWPELNFSQLDVVIGGDVGANIPALSVGTGSGSSNMTVYLELPDDNEHTNVSTVCDNKQAIWYGGNVGGLSTGSYLFMIGAETNKIIWSDVNNPLYFPENNYVYVGAANDRITRLAKMGDLLVIFKEHSTHYMKFIDGGGVTVEQLVKGTVTDVTAASATFPLVNIHDSIGCDLPNTVQLCRNRLVWATSAGKVYTLVTASYTSELNIHEVSLNIQPALVAADKIINNACATDWNGYYVLSLGKNKLFLLNYNNYGFVNVQSYSKTENAQEKNEWYIWELEHYVKGMTTINEKILLTITGNNSQANHDRDWVCTFDVDKTYDCYYMSYPTFDPPKTQISSSFATKVFHFGYPEFYKNVELLYIGVASKADSALSVSFATHRGDVGERVISLGTDEDIKQSRLAVMQNRVKTFGVKIKSNGQFSLDSLIINWKPQGGIK